MRQNWPTAHFLNWSEIHENSDLFIWEYVILQVEGYYSQIPSIEKV